MDIKKVQLLIIGGGPGGYSAAFRAADLGLNITIIEKENRLGGVCLNIGCIPSKTLLHIAAHIEESKKMNEYGVAYSPPEINLDKIRDHKNKVVSSLANGILFLAQKRKVEIINGNAVFNSASSIIVKSEAGESEIHFEKCIIATGSRPRMLKNFPNDDERLWDSTDALELNSIPKELLIVGGGIISMEMLHVYKALGSNVTVVELLDQIIPVADADVVRPLVNALKKDGVKIYTDTEIKSIRSAKDGLVCQFGDNEVTFDNSLVAIGRVPNTDNIQIEKTGIELTKNGLINVNEKMETSVNNIYAIGDIVGQPQLAHKAVYEGKIAAEVIAGKKSSFLAMTVPSVAYTHPEIAWTGLTEKEAKEKGIEYEIGKFPFTASGRALSQGHTDGFTKILFDKKTGRIIGAAITGQNAGELIGEATLALEMGSDIEDIAGTIHPHPTLSESIFLAAEAANGTITDLLNPKSGKR